VHRRAPSALGGSSGSPTPTIVPSGFIAIWNLFLNTINHIPRVEVVTAFGSNRGAHFFYV
jgi:hypothetical protein